MDRINSSIAFIMNDHVLLTKDIEVYDSNA